MLRKFFSNSAPIPTHEEFITQLNRILLKHGYAYQGRYLYTALTMYLLHLFNKADCLVYFPGVGEESSEVFFFKDETGTNRIGLLCESGSAWDTLYRELQKQKSEYGQSWRESVDCQAKDGGSKLRCFIVLEREFLFKLLEPFSRFLAAPPPALKLSKMKYSLYGIKTTKRNLCSIFERRGITFEKTDCFEDAVCALAKNEVQRYQAGVKTALSEAIPVKAVAGIVQEYFNFAQADIDALETKDSITFWEPLLGKIRMLLHTPKPSLEIILAYFNRLISDPARYSNSLGI